jgi:hypothetical protein
MKEWRFVMNSLERVVIKGFDVEDQNQRFESMLPVDLSIGTQRFLTNSTPITPK